MNATFLWYTYIFAKESDPHGRLSTAHVHSEGGLQEGVGHTCQVHVVISALLQGLKPSEVFGEQEEGVVIDGEGLRGHVGLLRFV